MSVFLAPHCDDEVLFGAFTLLRENPLVVVIYDCGPEREAETETAIKTLGCDAEYWRVPLDVDEAWLAEQINAIITDRLYAPLPEKGGQPQHNLVGRLALNSGKQVVSYLTYTDAGKSDHGTQVPFELDWIRLKLLALACYPSQSGHSSHAPHFIRDQTEYTA